MGQLKTSVIIDLAGNLERRAKRYGKSMNKFRANAVRNMSMVKKSAHGAGGTMGMMLMKYKMLIAMGATVGSAKFVVDLDERLTQLAINADLAQGAIKLLKKDIYDTATKGGIRTDTSEMIGAIEEIVKRTGDLKLARTNLEGIGMAISATGASGKDIGSMVANLFEKFNIRDANVILKTIDTMSLQGKEGAFELADFATQMNEVAAAYAATGRKGPAAAKEMGAILQMIMRTSGSAAEASTNFQRMLSTITSEKVKELQKRGIQLFDAKELAKGIKVMRPIPDIIKDIIRTTGGDEEKLAQVFDIRAMRGLRAFALEFKATGAFKDFDKFLAMQGDGATLMADSARKANIAAGAIRNLSTAWKRFSDNVLSGPLQSLADMLNALGNETVGKILKYGIGGAVGGYAAYKVYRGGRRLFGKGVGAGHSHGGGLGMPIPLPVYVVNKRMSLIGDALGGKPTGGTGQAGKTSKVSKLAKLGKFAKYAGPVGLAGAAGYGAGSLINKTILEGSAFQRGLGRAIVSAMSQFGFKEAKLIIEMDDKAREMAKVRLSKATGMDVDVDSGLRVGGRL